MESRLSDRSPNSKSAPSPGMSFELPIHEIEVKLAELEALAQSTNLELTDEIESLRGKLLEKTEEVYKSLSAWERVNVARHPERPVTSDYVEHVLDDFIELHGDRCFGDDQAMLTGLARIGEERFMLIGHRKGTTIQSRIACNFGCAHPEGYRKALRKMRVAEKMRLPIVAMINTPGAYPGIGAEERGQAGAIAENILAMFSLTVPILVIVIGEGGSGGALGIGIGDRVLMLEHAYYSVISPEGCAAILWKSGDRTEDAAEALKLTSDDLEGLNLIDGIVREPLGGAHRDRETAMASVKAALLRELAALKKIPVDELLAMRRQKYRTAGHTEGRFPTVAGA